MNAHTYTHQQRLDRKVDLAVKLAEIRDARPVPPLVARPAHRSLNMAAHKLDPHR